MQALERKGISALFPIQKSVFDPAMAGTDLVARARTGSGKTLAFSLPIIESIMKENQEEGGGNRFRTPRALILAPTRELAKQVAGELASATDGKSVRVLTVYGGTPLGAQIRQLENGVDVLVGTPGRVIDLAQKRECGPCEAFMPCGHCTVCTVSCCFLHMRQTLLLLLRTCRGECISETHRSCKLSLHYTHGSLLIGPMRAIARTLLMVPKTTAGPSLSAVQASLKLCIDVLQYCCLQQLRSGRLEAEISGPRCRVLRLNAVRFFVLDEADEMLNMGFQEDVEQILESVPDTRQTLMFSATMPTWVRKLARKYCSDHIMVDLVGEQDTGTPANYSRPTRRVAGCSGCTIGQAFVLWLQAA
jgi:DEAD/DEAH box helicase